MKTIKIALMCCVVLLGLTLACHAYDIVQVTNTPEADETDYSIAIFGDTIYTTWVVNSSTGQGGELYFDKSTDLGKTWGQYRKVIKTLQSTPAFKFTKMRISQNGKIFILYSWNNQYPPLLISENGGDSFFESGLSIFFNGINDFDFTIDELGNIIYIAVVSNGKIFICKSSDGGNAFSGYQEVPSSLEAREVEIETSKDGKEVYLFITGSWFGFTRSLDYGETFDEFKRIQPNVSSVFERYIDAAIDKNGKIYATWTCGPTDWSAAPIYNMLCESNDKGDTFFISRISDFYDWYHSGSWPGKPVISSISIDNVGNIYIVFYKYISADSTLYGLYFDKSLSLGVFGVDKYITGSIISLPVYNPLITLTPDGVTAFIMWSNANVEGGNRDLYCTTFLTNPPPVFDPPISNKEVNEGSLLDFTVSATDPDEDALAYSAANLPQGATFNPQTHIFTWTPNYNQAGIYENIKFTVSDGVNTTEETITITVNNTNRSPVINPIGNKSVNEGVLLQFTVSATDPDGDTITYSMLNAPEGTTIDAKTGQFNWTPNYNQAGSYIVTFVASDGDLSDGDTITLKVDNVPLMPTLNPIGSKQVNKGTLLEFTVSVAGPDADRVQYAVYLAGDLNHDNVLAPMDVLRIISTLNRYGPDITSTRPGWNPEMDLTNDGHITSRDALLAINMLNKGMTTKPSGISLDSKTGRFSWRPTVAQVGTHRLTFVASDGGLSDAETIIITVKNGSLLWKRIKGVRI